MTNQKVEVGSSSSDSHSPQDQLRDIDYCITSPPPWPQAVALGFQHYFVVLGTTALIPTLLVPQMGGDTNDLVRVIQTLLFMVGINTLLQSLFGTRLPAVMGGSYAFLVPILSIIHSGSLTGIEDDGERFQRSMRAIQGALLASSTLQIVLGFSGLWGIVTRFLSPLSAVPVIAMVALGLYELGFPGVGKCVEIGIPQLLLLVVLSQYLKNIKVYKTHLFERFSVLISVAIIWAYAHVMTAGGAYHNSRDLTQRHCRTDYAGLVGAAPWLRIPYPFQWGAPTFDASHIFGMIGAIFVSLVESTGGFLAVSRFAGATIPPPSVFSRGAGWQGIGLVLNGLFGAISGSTVSIENAGLLGLNRVGSRRVVQVAAGFMIFFSLFGYHMTYDMAPGNDGKFGAIFASVPPSIVAALFCVLFAKVVACGLSFLQFVNVNQPRSMFILGFSAFLALSIPQYFKEYALSAGHGPVRTDSHWFNDIFFATFTSAATVAFIIGMVLDNSLDHRHTHKDRGMGYWAKFRNWNDDPRTEEFYLLPFNLNKYFPST